jgi:hypothetical protein
MLVKLAKFTHVRKIMRPAMQYPTGIMLTAIVIKSINPILYRVIR